MGSSVYILTLKSQQSATKKKKTFALYYQLTNGLQWTCEWLEKGLVERDKTEKYPDK